MKQEEFENLGFITRDLLDASQELEKLAKTHPATSIEYTVALDEAKHSVQVAFQKVNLLISKLMEGK